MATLGDRAADRLTDFIGSWRFIVGQAAFLGVWMLFNALALTQAVHFDGPPFIALNLFMSAEAAFTGPIILMSSNRSDAADRKVLQADFEEDTVTNRLVAQIAEHLGIKE